MKESCTKREKSKAIAIFMICLMATSLCIGLPTSSYFPLQESAQELLPEEDVAISSSDDLPLRISTRIVYDSESDRIIFFGGATHNIRNDYSDTWSFNYDTNTWTNMTMTSMSPDTHPPATTLHQMAYDSAAHKVILFGGLIHINPYIMSSQTWAYDFASNTWINMAPTTAPPGVSFGEMVYDSESDVMVLFGGTANDMISTAETWIYSYGANTWTNVTTSVHPSSRVMHAMTYDTESDLVILFGGTEWDPLPKQTVTDTWTYDTNTNTWTEMSPSQHPISIGALTYDSDYDKALFFGGTQSWVEDIVYSETWTYDCDTDTWLDESPSTKPDARSRGFLAYDSESERTILFGGVLWGGWSNESILHDCWSYDMNTNLWNNVDWDWQEMTPAISPGLRSGSPLVYDVKSDRMAIFSGWPDLHSDGVRYNDTWTYDYNSNTWTNMSPSALPPGRGGHAMAYDEKADVMIMFGGVTGWQVESEKYKADTWKYDLNSNTWTNMSPATHPSPRIFANMVYDNQSDVVVLFGGYMPDNTDSYETWIYNLTSNTWTDATTSVHPEGRFFAGMTYDYKRGRVLLGGGGRVSGFPNDIWEYDISTGVWTPLTHITATQPFDFAISYDLESDLIVAWGGPTNLYEDVFVRETWTFNFEIDAAYRVFSPHEPIDRSRPHLAYDIESDRTIMYGGALPDGSQGEALGDTWAYNYKVNYEEGQDYDEDGLSNILESLVGTNPLNNDTDSDKMLDGWEYYNQLNPLVDDAAGDRDNDGLLNLEEFQKGTDPNNPDSDSDFVIDGDEVHIYGTNPLLADSDSDLMPDGFELYYGLDPLLNDTYADLDSDGLSNYWEYMNGTSPNNNDTDSDLASDGWEVYWGFNPLNSSDGSDDADKDGLLNYLEQRYNTNPCEVDTDSDGFSDYWEVMNGFNATDKNVQLWEYVLGYSGQITIAIIGVIAVVVGYRFILFRENNMMKRKLLEEEEERQRAFKELAEHANNESVGPVDTEPDDET